MALVAPVCGQWGRVWPADILLSSLQAPSHRYEGHGSHVTNVDFTHNDSHLLSMGGKDTTILQWRVRQRGTEILGTQASNQQIRAEQ